MPTYDYQCSHCGHELEVFQLISAKPLRKCPQCGRQALKRLIGTGAGVIFKGAGFWQTDYRSDSYKKGAEAEKKTADEKKDTTNTSTTATDKKKPATAQDAKPAAKKTP